MEQERKMTIASELQDLATNLQNAKDAVEDKGGTVGDTELAGLATEIASIPSGGGGLDTIPVEMEGETGEGHITGYNTTTGVITGDGFGSTAVTVWLMDRDTHTYKKQGTSSWSDTSITLTTPIDLSVIEGCTSLCVADSKDVWATKWLIDGEIAVRSDVYTVYIKSPSTGEIVKQYPGDITYYSGSPTRYFGSGENRFQVKDIVGIQIGSNASWDAVSFAANCINLNQPIIIPQKIWRTDSTLATTLNFNQPIKLLDGNSSTSLGNNFMQGAFSFNQPITIPTTCGAIGAYFMYSCYNYNQDIIIPNTVTSIGNYFCGLFYVFNKTIYLPSTTTSIGTYFGYRICEAYTLQTETSHPPNDNNSLATLSPLDASYTAGITIKGSKRATWRSALSNRTSSPYRKTIDGGE